MSRVAPPTRRQFVAAAAATAAAAVFAPRIALSRAARESGGRSGLDDIVIGEGDHTYRVIHDWGRLPDGIKYGNTHGVCEDSQGRIYIKHTVGADSSSDDAIVVFDADGKFVRSWGAEFKGGAHGLHLHKEGSEDFLYLADQARGIVVKTTLDGQDVWRRRCPDDSGLYGTPAEYRPTNIAVAPNGDIYVADGYGKSWIHIYTPRGDYVRSFGGLGKERGQTNCPHGIMVDLRGYQPMLVVADRSNRRLQYFTLDGRHGWFVTDELRSPCHFHFRGEEMVVPDLEARVSIFDKKNKLIVHLGDGQNFALRDKPRDQFIPGKFIAPHSAIFDHKGNIFVVEWVEVGRVTRLERV
jgi:DNA-binding beta-propeller fold protein YncE